MLRRAIATLTACTALTFTAAQTPAADASPDASRPQPTPSATPHPLSIDEPAPPPSILRRHTDTGSLYRQAGIDRHPRPDTPRVSTTAVDTAPGGIGNLIPGVARHVPQSCTGTTEGNRVQALYVREADQPDRYASVAPVIRNELQTIDDIFAVSAAQTGGGRRVRWVFTPDCTIDIANVTVPDGAITGDLSRTRTALRSLGYDLASRKYLAFADVPVGGLGGSACGMADSFGDPTPDASNQNNGSFTMMGRVDLECWVRGNTTNFSAAAHELMHMLGAVQPSAPHFTSSAHCSDFYDPMCAANPTTNPACPFGQADLFDCGKDDYFSTNPTTGSWLATHWNTANSSFLDAAAPLATPTMTVTANRTSAETGDPVAFTATVDSGTTVTWSTINNACVASPTTGTTFTINCPYNYGNQDVVAVASNPSADGTKIIHTPITVTNAPDPILTTNAASQVPANTPFTQTVTMTQGKGPFTYRWATTDTRCAIDGSTTTTTFTRTCPSSAIGATIPSTITVTSADQRVSSTTLFTTVTSAALSATINGPTAVPSGTTATFTAAVVNGNSPTYAWTSSRGWIVGSTTAASVNVAVPADAIGSDTLTVTVRNSNGTTATATANYGAQTPLTMTLNAPANLAKGSSAAVSVDLSKTATVTWSDNQSACTVTATAATTANLSCGPTYVGPVTITAVATAGTESVSQSKTVDVQDPSAAPVLHIVAPSSADSGVKTPLNVTNSGAVVATWAWNASVNDCFFGATTTQTATLQCAMDYVGPVTVTVTGRTAAGVSSSDSMDIEVSRPDFTATLDVPASIVAGDSTPITARIRADSGDSVKVYMGIQQSTNNGDSWTNVAAETLTDTGMVTVNVAPKTTTLYRLISSALDVEVIEEIAVIVRPITATLSKSGDSPTTLTARFVSTNGDVENRKVLVQVAYDGSTAWQNIPGNPYTTNTYGKVTVNVTPTRPARYRVLFAGDDMYAPRTTNVVYVGADTVMTIAVDKGSTDKITGALRTAASKPVAAAKVYLQWKPKGSTSWSTLKYDVTNDLGKVALTRTTGKDGSYRLTFNGNTQYAPSKSVAVAVTH